MKPTSIKKNGLRIFIGVLAACQIYATAFASEGEERCQVTSKLQSNIKACSKLVSLPSVDKLYVLYGKNSIATDRSSSNILIKAWEERECDNSDKGKDKDVENNRIDCNTDFHVSMKKISGGDQCGFIIDNPKKQSDQLKIVIKRKSRSKIDNCEMQMIIRAPAFTQLIRNVYNKAEAQIVGMKALIGATSTSGDIHAEVTSPQVNLTSKTGSLWAYGLTKRGKIMTRGGDVAVQYCKTPENQTGELQLLTLTSKDGSVPAGYVSLFLPQEMEYWMHKSLKKQLKKANHLKTQVPECGYANCKSFKMRGDVRNYMYVSALPQKAANVCRF